MKAAVTTLTFIVALAGPVLGAEQKTLEERMLDLESRVLDLEKREIAREAAKNEESFKKTVDDAFKAAPRQLEEQTRRSEELRIQQRLDWLENCVRSPKLCR